jgi:hypothetical protein
MDENRSFKGGRTTSTTNGVGHVAPEGAHVLPELLTLRQAAVVIRRAALQPWPCAMKAWERRKRCRKRIRNSISLR